MFKTERFLLLEQLIILGNFFVHRFSILQELVGLLLLGLDQVQFVSELLILIGCLSLDLPDLLLVTLSCLLQGVFEPSYVLL